MRRFAARGVVVLAVLASAAVVASGTLAAGQPTVAAGTASNLADTSATLNGTVNPQGQATNYAFQYGTTTDYGRQTTLTPLAAESADKPVTADIRDLTPGTTYHVRVIASNASGTVVSDDTTFRTTGTAPPPAPKPAVTTGAATATRTGATLNGAVNPNGRATSFYFEFGETTNYGQQTPPRNAGAGTRAVSVNATLSGLKEQTAYHYRLVAVGPGNAITTGADGTFTTGAAPSSKLAFFGHTSFADQNGVGGIFLGCFGGQECKGGLKLVRGGKVVAERSGFTIKADSGGIVHFSLNELGQRLLRARGTMRVRTTVTPASGGSAFSGVTTLTRFPSKGLKG